MKELRGLHEASIRTTLDKLSFDEHVPTIEVGQDTLRELLQEVFDLRWQNRKLQARGTELVTEMRAQKRSAKKYGGMLKFLGSAIGEPVNRKAILERVPELFEDADKKLAELQERYPRLWEEPSDGE